MINTVVNKNLGVVSEYLAKRVSKLETGLLEACRRSDEPAALGILTDLLDVSHIRQLSQSVLAQLPSDTSVPSYELSTLTIHEAYSALTKTADEDLRFATGFPVAPMTYAVTRLLQFELKRKNVIAAEGEQEAVARVLIGLHNHDHKLYMTWHSHPGSGPDSTTPSSIDMDFHRRLELGKYPVIGAIVNRQGYVRFYSYKRAFKVQIYGKIEVINEQSCLFKLDKIGAV